MKLIKLAAAVLNQTPLDWRGNRDRVAQAIREAKLCKESGESKTILFNLCGHGHLDLQAYNDYFDGKLQDHYLTEEELKGSLKELADYPPVA